MTSRMNRPWVLISGASSGFGQATATLLASRGWNLLLTSRRADRLEEVAASCRQHGAEVHVEAWDVRDRAATDAGVATLMKRANVGQGEGQTPLHALVNNAGLAVGKGPFDEGLDDDWNRMIDTNVKGVLFLARACFFYMCAGSRMVNMGSIAGKQVYPGGNVYCASKHAVDALSQAMRIDLVDRGIGVSQVCPGAAETEFSVVRFKGDQAAANAVYQGFDPLLARDIAEAVEFILSRPRHVNINDLVIMPTAQASAHHLIRS
ncbi:MAG: SDR family NAD(P)-dependent oxidoreductase [Bacteroidetes bacterium]|nr:SDR family NAD(P)-dependent oxidoreductase [Bacteroidota bacterium]